MQLDIFEHSRDVMLHNDALPALPQRDAAAARRAAQCLAYEFPGDAALSDLAVLTAELEAPAGAAFTRHGDAATAHRRLQQQIVPAAKHLFGSADAAAWCRPLWR